MAAKPQILTSTDTAPIVTPALVGLSDASAPALEMREQMKSATAAAKETVAAATSTASQAAKDASSRMANTAEAAADQAKQQFQALMQAGNLMVKGADEVSREFSGYMQASMSGAAEVAKAMLAARTLQDVVKIQSDYMKSSFDSLVGNTSKISEIGVRVATEAWAPLASRMQQGMEKMVRPAA